MNRNLAALGIAVLFVVLSAAGAGAQKMPPGMTPQIMHMMMTPPTGPHPGAPIPAEAKPIGGCIPTMGYHYVDPKKMPRGPLYGYYNGKPIFTELMLNKAELAGQDWNDQLKPLPGYTIDHVDIWYEPHGHPGYSAPHFDVHAWYVPHAEHMTYCGNKSGKRPVFV